MPRMESREAACHNGTLRLRSPIKSRGMSAPMWRVVSPILQSTKNRDAREPERKPRRRIPSRSGSAPVPEPMYRRSADRSRGPDAAPHTSYWDAQSTRPDEAGEVG